MRARLVTLSLLLGLATGGSAQVAPEGPEFQVNTFTLDFQQYPDAAMDAAGNFVVVWASYYQDGDFGGVFGQRYDSDGNTAGTEFQVNATSFDDQYFPAVASDAQGNFVVVWTSYYQDGDDLGIFGQRFASDGAAVGPEFQVNSETAYYQGAPAVAMDDDGSFVVTWMSELQDGDDFGVYAQRYDSEGNPLGAEFRVNSTVQDYQGGPSVGMDENGDFVIAWTSYGQDGSGYGVFAQRYEADGDPVGGETQINAESEADQLFPSLTATGSAEFVTTWMSDAQDGSDFGVFGRRLSGEGSLGAEIPVNTTTEMEQSLPDVAAGNDGGFLVTWASEGQDGDGFGIVARAFDGSDTALGDEIVVNTSTALDQTSPTVAGDGSGNFVTAWRGEDEDFFGIFARRLVSEGDGRPCPGDCDDGGDVTVNELIIAVNIALGNQSADACPAADSNGDGSVVISELIQAVNAALQGCPGP